jgi:GTP-binding protein
MFIDNAEIVVRGGHGGAGKISFGKKMRSGPDGGNGGKGGDVFFEAVNDITLLLQFITKDLYEAEDGHPGEVKRKTGKDGNNLIIRLPVGTTVTDKLTGNTLFELINSGQREIVCKGGRGGRGNFEFRSSRRTTPKIAQPGLPGDVKKLILNLKLIADYGLIGLPNAGKSSLLNELTNAKSKVANYPFTTLTPNLGVFADKIIADIPGLIEGASLGRGLGISFLKHIEKVGLLIHCISCESGSPLADYGIIRKELGKYNKKLLEKPEIILITKSDLADTSKIKKIMDKLKSKSDNVQSVSIHNWESLEGLKNFLKKQISRLKLKGS